VWPGRYTAWMARQKPSDDDLTIRGGDDFLANQGIADPDEFRVKSHLCHEIATIAERRGLLPADLARLAGEAVQDIERIVRSRHDGYEVWRLIKMLTALGADVGIFVLPNCGHDRGVVSSETMGELGEHRNSDLAPPGVPGGLTKMAAEILAVPESIPESAMARIREIADSHPDIEVELGGGLDVKHTAIGTIGSGNVFADLGLPDAEILLQKAKLVSKIDDAIIKRGLSAGEAGAIMGFPPERLSALLNGRTAGYSVLDLQGLLDGLLQRAEIDPAAASLELRSDLHSRSSFTREPDETRSSLAEPESLTASNPAPTE
jgi:predicted XRE-type DNA-binding protein